MRRVFKVTYMAEAIGTRSLGERVRTVIAATMGDAERLVNEHVEKDHYIDFRCAFVISIELLPSLIEAKPQSGA